MFTIIVELFYLQHISDIRTIFFKKNFGGHEFFLWGSDTPILDFW